MPENLDLSAFDTSQLDQFLLADLDGDGNPELLMNDHDGSTGTKPPWFRIFSLNLDSSNPRADAKEVFLQDVDRVPPYSLHGFPDFMHGLCYADASSGDRIYLFPFYAGLTEDGYYAIQWVTLSQTGDAYTLAALPESVNDADAYFAGRQKTCVSFGQWNDYDHAQENTFSVPIMK